jgi:hypothetical protein
MNNFKRILKENGISITLLCDVSADIEAERGEAGLQISLVSKIQNGWDSYSIRTLDKIVRALNNLLPERKRVTRVDLLVDKQQIKKTK